MSSTRSGSQVANDRYELRDATLVEVETDPQVTLILPSVKPLAVHIDGLRP